MCPPRAHDRRELEKGFPLTGPEHLQRLPVSRIADTIPPMNTTRVLAWNTAVQAFGKVISTVIGVAVVAIMTRHLGQEGFGYYSTANAYFQIFAIILDFGLNVILVQVLGENAGNDAFERRVTSAVYTLRASTGFVLLSGAAFLGLAMPYPWELKMAIFAIWGSFFFTALNQIVIGVQQRHLKMHVVAISEVLGRLVLLGGVLLAQRFSWGLVPIVGIVSIGSTLNFLVNLLVARRYSSFAWNWDVELWKTLLKRSWPVGVSIVFNLLYYKADTLILSYLRPFTEVGIYGAAYRVLEILITLPYMYCGVLLPLIANAWSRGDKDAFRTLMRQSYVVMLLLAAPMVAGTILLGDRIMSFVAGAAFAESGAVLKILMFAMGIIFFGTVSSHAVVAINQQRAMMKYYIMIALVTCAGYLIFIPIYGMYAAAWFTVFSEFMVALISTLMTLYHSHIQINWTPHLKILGCAALMALCVFPLRNVWLPVPILAGIVSYTALILLSGVISKDTLQQLLSFRSGVPPTDAT
jgi:O-antigen/teichoic acid export membrane protein